MIQTNGYAAHLAKAPLRQFSFERRDPRNHDVVIDIQYCGICHTDVHQVNDEWGGSTFPMVPGHEIVGIVTKVGANVSRYKLDDRVGVGCLVDSCCKCSPCMKGLEQVTTRKQDEAKRMGADKFYVTSILSPTGQDNFEELEGYFDLILNTLSVEIDWNRYLNLLALDGTMIVVGHPEKETPLSASTLINARRSLAGSGIGGIKETQRMLDFCSKYNISSDIELIPIHGVNEAYPRVVNSDVRYRFVVDTKSLG